MKQKKPYIKVDLDKENPLITIVKAGKIPVIRRNKYGFKNYNQDAYFKSKNESLETPVTDYPETGCFCLLGGIFGNWVTGAHYKEPINIGFIEPETIVFSTYGFNKECQWKYTTAKERHMDAMREFITSYNCGVDTPYDTEDFEVSEEAIVNAKDITRVCTIAYEDYYKFIRFGNDTMYSLFQKDNLFHTIIYDLPKQFLMKYNVETINEFHKAILKNDDRGKDSYLEWYSSLQNCILDDLKDYVVNKNKSVAHHTIAFANAVRNYPLYVQKENAMAFDLITAYLHDTQINDEITSLFPELDGRYTVRIRSTDRVFSIDFDFDSWFCSYAKKYKQRTISMDYFTDTRQLNMHVEEDKTYKDGDYYTRKANTKYDIDLNDDIRPDFQACILCFVELFNIYMHHFGQFFLIRPFDTYYRFNEILDKIHELDDDEYVLKWNLSNDMSRISYQRICNNDDIQNITYDFGLQDSIIENDINR